MWLTLFIFFVLFRIKTDLIKYEIADIGVLKGVQVAVCGCIDLNNDTRKILGSHFFDNEKLKNEKKNYKTVT